MSLLKTLLKPDYDDDPEQALVAHAANILQIGEFQLLQVAYKDWYGEDMPEGMIDTLFATYMLHHEVPSWARAFARRVVAAEAEGDLNADHPYFHQYDVDRVTHVPRGRRDFISVALIIACLLAGSFWISSAVIGEREVQGGFPPFFFTDELDRDGTGASQ